MIAVSTVNVRTSFVFHPRGGGTGGEEEGRHFRANEMKHAFCLHRLNSRNSVPKGIPTNERTAVFFFFLSSGFFLLRRILVCFFENDLNRSPAYRAIGGWFAKTRQARDRNKSGTSDSVQQNTGAPGFFFLHFSLAQGAARVGGGDGRAAAGAGEAAAPAAAAPAGGGLAALYCLFLYCRAAGAVD
eukprot:COSAG06_NODE_29477_length_555_cov_2.241228_1_plen_185_part_11